MYNLIFCISSTLTNVAMAMYFSLPPHSTLSASSPSASPSPDLQPQQWGVDKSRVVIIAAVVCAVVCAIGLNSMLRCVLVCVHGALTGPVGWVLARRFNSGLRKKDVVSLPTSVYPGMGMEMSRSSSSSSSSSSCCICLVDFVDGDSVRFLPKCGHGFHVGCIDQWLLSHSSCPTCRLHLNPHHTCFNIPSSL